MRISITFYIANLLSIFLQYVLLNSKIINYIYTTVFTKINLKLSIIIVLKNFFFNSHSITNDLSLSIYYNNKYRKLKET